MFLLPIGLSYAQDEQGIQMANEYLLRGDKEKAYLLYSDLARSELNIPVIHTNYLDVMMDLNKIDEALKYLHKLERQDPGNLQYALDLAFVYIRSGDTAKGEKEVRDIISKYRTNVTQIKIVSDYFMSHHLLDYAVTALKESRDALGNSYLYCLDLAMLYRLQGKNEEMVSEYLNYVTQNSGNIQYVKNVMQALLTRPEDLQSLEQILYRKIQDNPDMEVYPDLLVWVTMQERNFYAAFIQARAYDKRFHKQGEKCMEVAGVASSNEAYEDASRIYGYVIREFSSGPYYLPARLGLMSTREVRIRNSYPVNLDSVRTLIGDYRKFTADYPNIPQAMEAKRSEALLYANYLGELDTAIALLQELINDPSASFTLKSRAKIDLADTYVLKGEPWESALLYAQVDKTENDNPLGYEAKLKNAKLSYYRGDFKLAEEQLDILKEATTREIANDAMDLSLRIKENLAYDSLGRALRQYSKIELLEYRNKIDDALQQIEYLKEGRARFSATDAFALNLSPADSGWVSFPNYGILDDTYLMEAGIRLKKGEFNEALDLLQKIIDAYGDDVLADNALFTQAEIYEKHLDNKDKAMEKYLELLTRYPGSVFAAEARKRYRMLRGDYREDTSTEMPLN